MRLALFATLLLAPWGHCLAVEESNAILDATLMYKSYFGETLVDELYDHTGAKEILGKWHPNSTGPDRIKRLVDGRLAIHEVKAYSDWPSKAALRTRVDGEEMDELSDAWIEKWKVRVNRNPLATPSEREAVQAVEDAHRSDRLVRIDDEINLGDGKWRSWTVFPNGSTNVRLETKAGPDRIERIERKWAESVQKLNRLRAAKIEQNNKAIRSPRLTELEKRS